MEDPDADEGRVGGEALDPMIAIEGIEDMFRLLPEERPENGVDPVATATALWKICPPRAHGIRRMEDYLQLPIIHIQDFNELLRALVLASTHDEEDCWGLAQILHMVSDSTDCVKTRMSQSSCSFRWQSQI